MRASWAKHWPQGQPSEVDVATLPAAGLLTSPLRLIGDGDWLGVWGDFVGYRLGLSTSGETWQVATGTVMRYPQGVDIFQSQTGGSGTRSCARFLTREDALDWVASSSGRNARARMFSEEFLLAGSPATWTRPAGVTTVRVLVVGGGGGGGGSIAGVGTNAAAGGGGGGGVLERDVDVSGDVTVTTGAAGLAGAATGADGGDGGDTSFGALVVAAGGEGGMGGSILGTARVSGGCGGGAGVLASVNVAFGGSGGGAGGSGETDAQGATIVTVVYGGRGEDGGAGSAGISASAGVPFLRGGQGIDGFGGGGGGGATTAAANSSGRGVSGSGAGGVASAVGDAATRLGCGGGGAAANSATGRAGGAGAAGYCRVTWWA